MTARDECRRFYASVRLDRQPRGRFMQGRCIAFQLGSIGPWLERWRSGERAQALAEAAQRRRDGLKSAAKVWLINAREIDPAPLP